MKTAAIICEYNPFHNGHLTQINLIKKELKADVIVCIMSGDFVQRGEPAVFDKFTRASHALNNGADVVLMLPVFASTASADLFSYSAVSILNRLNCIDFLCFGAECDDPSRLMELSDKLKDIDINSPEIKDLLKRGLTFASARASLLPEYKDILKGSNNVLALEYLNALKILDSKIEPYIIKREGTPYNGLSLSKDRLPSASAIRNVLCEGDVSSLNSYVPSDVFMGISKETPVFLDDFSQSLYYKLLSENDYADYLEISSDLSNGIKKKMSSFVTFSSYIDALKSKNLTYSRISRGLLHILLNIKGNNEQRRNMADTLSCVRMLGFKNSDSVKSFFKTVDKNSDIKIISNPAKDSDSFNDVTKNILKEDLFAASLYNNISSAKSGKLPQNDCSRKMIVV
jgi:predicted nucleotidyltransferase